MEALWWQFTILNIILALCWKKQFGSFNTFIAAPLSGVGTFFIISAFMIIRFNMTHHFLSDDSYKNIWKKSLKRNLIK